MTPVRRHVLALLRGVALAGLAIAGLALLVITVFTRVLAVMTPQRWGRRMVSVHRRLASAWSGITVAEPYRPPPAPRGSWYLTYQDRMDWLNNDPASGRDDTYLFVNPLVATVLGAGPAALVIAGPAVAVSVGTIPAVALGLVAAAVGVLVAPASVRLHGRWTALLLGPVQRPASYVGAGFALIRCVALLGLSLIGLGLSVVTVVAFMLAGLGLVFAPLPVTEHGRWLANLRRRLARAWSEVDIPTPYRPRPESTPEQPTMVRFNARWHWLTRDPAAWRDLLWTLLDPFVTGLLTLVPTVLVAYGVHGLLLGRLWRSFGSASGSGSGSGGSGDWYGAVAGSEAAAVPVGIALTAIALLIARPIMHAANRWTRLLLAPTAKAALELRVQRLTVTRADAVDDQAAELRRIERDLHDGAQARLVAVGLSLGAIEALIDRDPDSAKVLIGQARQTSARALADLRDLVRGIHPPVLAERGLGDAIRALALDAPLPVTVDADLPGRAGDPVESAAYFAVAEAMTNAVRHAGAGQIAVDLRHRDGTLYLTVTDDGHGGADPAGGSGLRGVARRLGTFDGTMTVTSPPGGPTTVAMEIPCVLSSPRTNPSSGKG